MDLSLTFKFNSDKIRWFLFLRWKSFAETIMRLTPNWNFTMTSTSFFFFFWLGMASNYTSKISYCKLWCACCMIFTIYLWKAIWKSLHRTKNSLYIVRFFYGSFYYYLLLLIMCQKLLRRCLSLPRQQLCLCIMLFSVQERERLKMGKYSNLSSPFCMYKLPSLSFPYSVAGAHKHKWRRNGWKWKNPKRRKNRWENFVTW
jgi:hypothetical protein